MMDGDTILMDGLGFVGDSQWINWYEMNRDFFAGPRFSSLPVSTYHF